MLHSGQQSPFFNLTGICLAAWPEFAIWCFPLLRDIHFKVVAFSLWGQAFVLLNLLLTRRQTCPYMLFEGRLHSCFLINCTFINGTTSALYPTVTSNTFGSGMAVWMMTMMMVGPEWLTSQRLPLNVCPYNVSYWLRQSPAFSSIFTMSFIFWNIHWVNNFSTDKHVCLGMNCSESNDPHTFLLASSSWLKFQYVQHCDNILLPLNLSRASPSI